MKKGLKRLTALLLIAILLCPCLFACADTGEPLLSYKNAKITEDVYRYWMACYRAQFSAMETDENRDRLAEIAHANIERSLVCVGLFDGYGLTLDTAARDIVNAAIESMEESLGGREALEEALSVWGMDINGLKTAITHEQKAAALREYLFGEDGVYAISEETAEEYCQNSYSRVYMIFIPYVDFETDADGNRIFDPVTQSYRYKAKSEPKLAVQEYRAGLVRAAVTAEGGITQAAFLDLVKEYNEDESAASYENGYFFSRDEDYSTYIEELPAAALSMKVGEVREVTSEYGVHFLYRAENPKGAYKDEKNADFFGNFDGKLKDQAFERLISAELPSVTVVNRELLDSIHYEAIVPNQGVYWG
ncbi:MAG: hypothetical protein IJ009_01055 [Clostridia bacterium]|nr:hypothetical protein [Clostridia bacterium]